MCDISCQTSYLFDNEKLFKRFNLNLEELKIKENIDNLDQFEDILLQLVKEHKTKIKEQILFRDKVIIILYRYLEDLINYGNNVEECNQSLNLNNRELRKKVNVLRKLLKNKKSIKTDNLKTATCVNTSTQTDEEANYNWDWYYQYYYSNNHDVNGDDDSNTPVHITKEDNQNDSVIYNDVLKEEDSTPCVDSKCESLKNKDTEFSLELQKISDAQNENIPEDDSQTLKENLEWNHSNIKQEVQELAEEITSQLGFVYHEDIGMYYDQSSGYYYDDKTRLYYDGKTGTYFFYDFETNSYQFHSQVTPVPVIQDEKNSDSKENGPKKRKSVIKSEDKEEGECSDSEEEEEEECGPIADSETSYNNHPIGAKSPDPADVAPSLRLMIMNGNLKGNLHLVTLDGGKIGREGNVEVLIKNVTVSKVHGEITYRSNGPHDHHYYIQDLGSENGTLVRGKRLSSSRVKSEPVEIGHGWEIACGDVVMYCHIHPGLLTCNECEPGLVSSSQKDQSEKEVLGRKFPRKVLEKERRRQNKAIRKKFSLGWTEETPPLNTKYKDRAEKRREVVGSDNPYEKTKVASIDTNLTQENKGFQILQKMGWAEGQSLGVKDGITEPVIPKVSMDRAGLGSTCFTGQPVIASKPVATDAKENVNSRHKFNPIKFTSASNNS